MLKEINKAVLALDNYDIYIYIYTEVYIAGFEYVKYVVDRCDLVYLVLLIKMCGYSPL